MLKLQRNPGFFGSTYFLPNHDLPTMSQWVRGLGLYHTFRNSSSVSHKTQIYDICILHTKGDVRSFHQPPSHDLLHDSKLCPFFLRTWAYIRKKQACLKHGTPVIWNQFLGGWSTKMLNLNWLWQWAYRPVLDKTTVPESKRKNFWMQRILPLINSTGLQMNVCSTTLYSHTALVLNFIPIAFAWEVQEATAAHSESLLIHKTQIVTQKTSQTISLQLR